MCQETGAFWSSECNVVLVGRANKRSRLSPSESHHEVSDAFCLAMATPNENKISHRCGSEAGPESVVSSHVVSVGALG